jgi:peptidoglycan/LPS O-acetylase OafA/YrhL
MKSDSAQRLLGVDLLRGIAAYAVVFIHSGDEQFGLPVSAAAINLKMIFYFAVPFFLATSFYFLISQPNIDISRRFCKSRIDRILIPYASWSIIYLVFRSIFFFQSQQMGRFWDLFQDPLAIICFGAASYQLYFLPLLFTGTFLLPIAKYLRKVQTNRVIISFLAILSLIVYEWLTRSGNAFRLNPSTAFQNLTQNAGWDINNLPLLRLVLVQIAWLLDCLPYLLIGILLVPLCDRINRCSSAYRITTIFLCVVVFSLISAAIFIGIPDTVKNIGQAYSLFLLSLALSGYIKKGWIFESVGNCSFGIYLMHPFTMMVVKKILTKILPNLFNRVSILSMLTISIGTFLISWIAIALMKKNRLIAKYTLGMTSLKASSNS